MKARGATLTFEQRLFFCLPHSPRRQGNRWNHTITLKISRLFPIPQLHNIMVFTISRKNHSTEMGHCRINVESVLRIRPLSKKEQTDDTILLEEVRNPIRNAPPTVALKPYHGMALTSPNSGSSSLRRGFDVDAKDTPIEYHFNHLFNESTSQDKIYYSLGLPIVTASMNTLKTAVSHKQSVQPDSHLLVCMGVTGSGKTYTCFGGNSIPKRRAAQDGLVPRLIDSLFSQSKHHTNAGSASKCFAINISMVQVIHSKGADPYACSIHDLLGNEISTKVKEKKKMSPKRTLTVRSMAAKFERALGGPILSPIKHISSDCPELDADSISPSVETCPDVTSAREIIAKGLSLSNKVSKSQNHLLITLQPVLDGCYYGDKVAILDMAGLEKGRKNQSRGKDSVANKNQAASAAVLHCLRTMIHNTNVQSGKPDPVDIADDTISELSAVSDAKAPVHRQIKTVPFRQHKVAMLLQPLFLSSHSVNATILLSAYPGHTDYYEKKQLLQDMELLCGSALATAGTTAATGLSHLESRSFESRSTLTRSTTLDDEESSVDQEPVLSSSRDFPTNNNKTYSALESSWEKVVLPAPHAPSYVKPSAPAHLLPIPSAPCIDTSEHCPMPIPLPNTNIITAPKNPDYIQDFPGVNMSSKHHVVDPRTVRENVTGTVDSARVGGPKATAPASSVSSPRLAGRHPTLEKESVARKRFLPDNSDSRRPLGRSSLENGRTSLDSCSSDEQSATRQKLRAIEATFGSVKPLREATVPDKDSANIRVFTATESGWKATVSTHETNARKATSSCVEKVSSKGDYTTPTNLKRGTDNRTTSKTEEQRFRILETKLDELQSENDALKKQCYALENENRQLRKKLHNTGSTTGGTWAEEEKFKKFRDARLADQSLLKGPLQSHLDRVNKIDEIKNQWCKTNKAHFGLEIPSNFQRASELDVRDAKGAQCKIMTHESGIASKGLQEQSRCTPLKFASKIRRSAKPKLSPLRALRSLTFKGQ